MKNEETTFKLYLLVFTCLNIRAVHLEHVPLMSTSYFLLDFIKFSNIYCLSPDTVITVVRSLMRQEVSSALEEKKNAIRHIKIPVHAA